MIVKTQLRADLQRLTQKGIVYAMQNDHNTRSVEISLYSDGASWEIPAGTTCAVGYKKPDGTSGLYDKMPDGETVAVSFSGNKLVALIAPQMLTVSGIVDASVFLYDENANRIGLFPFSLYVAEDPSAGKTEIGNYYYLSTLAAVNEAIGNTSELATTNKKNLVAAINEVATKGGGSAGVGGLTDAARTLLMTVLRNGVYTSDQSANLAALEEALKASGGGGSDEPDVPVVPDEPKTYTITNNLTNCTNSNSATSIEENSAYTAVITAMDGYELQSVIVTMGGSAVNVNGGTISISAVTGNIVITAVATAVSTETVEEALTPVLMKTAAIDHASAPDQTTYEYIVIEGKTAAEAGKSSVLFEAPEITGGTLVVDLDETRISGAFRFMILLLNADNTPYGGMVFSDGANGVSGELSHSSIKDPGAYPGWSLATGPFSVVIPDGKKPMVSILTNASYTTILDESLIDAENNARMYHVIDAVLAGEIITAKVVKEG